MPFALPVCEEENLTCLPLNTYLYLLHMGEGIDGYIFSSDQSVILHNDQITVFDLDQIRVR